MKYKYFFLSICSALCLCLSSVSYATIIDGHFNGWIYADESDQDIWNNDLRGKEISGYFTYDTQFAPLARESFPGITTYDSNNHWLDLFFYIDGKKIDALSVPRNDISLERSEGVSVSESFQNGYFYLGIFISGGDYAADYVDSGVSILIHGVPGLINGDSLAQNFSWQLTDSYPAKATFVELGKRDGIEYITYLEMYINKITVTARNQTTVPEPSSFIILLSGVLVLAANYRKHALNTANGRARK